MMHPRKGEFFSSRVRYISLNQIRPNPQQPRRSFDEDSLSELAESIRRYGILQPLTVRRTESTAVSVILVATAFFFAFS